MKQLLLCAVIALTACGGAGSEKKNANETEGTGGIKDRIVNGSVSGGGGGVSSDIVGVWDDSYDDPDYGFDEFYIVIDSNGNLSSYDYAGDAYDNWGNCYWINKNASKITSLGGAKYLISDSYDQEDVEEMEIKVSGNIMSWSFRDIDDGDEDGNTTEYLPEPDPFTRSTRTVASFTPECVDSAAAAHALIPTMKQKTSVLSRVPASKP